MPPFDPEPEETFSLRIDAQERNFRALRNPLAPTYAHSMEGGKARVYKIESLDAGSHIYALKVMKSKHRDPGLEQTCNNLDKLKDIAGLDVCERACLSPSRARDTISRFGNLEYSILMPWIQGKSWADVLEMAKKGQNILDKDGSILLASNFANVLAKLEANSIAHCDLSAGNIIIDPDPTKLQIELIDVEDLFALGFAQPAYLPLGTPGYQHKTSGAGQWHARGDRFAGAILLSEMLGWYDDTVRSTSYGESYFDSAELQSANCRRLDLLIISISRHSNDLATLLKRAWSSANLDDCPAISEWDQTMKKIRLGKYVVFEEPLKPTIGAKSPPIWTPLLKEPPKIEWEQNKPNLDEWNNEADKKNPSSWDQSDQKASDSKKTVEWE